jgi:hypothetical protein
LRDLDIEDKIIFQEVFEEIMLGDLALINVAQNRNGWQVL